MSTHSLIGHNRPPVDAPVAPVVENDQPWSFETRGDLPPDLPKMHYFQCDTHALYTALLRMPLDQRGFYITALLAMYDRMEPLPADDRAGMIATGVSDLRVYRRLKASLLDAERCLVQKPSGRISNARFEEEISKYVERFNNRSAGRKKAAATSVQRSTSNKDTPLANPLANPLASMVASGVGSPQLDADLSKKLNEISVGIVSIQAQLTVNEPDKLLDRVIIEEEGRKEGRLPDSESQELPLSETHVSDVGVKAGSKRVKYDYSDAFEAFWRDYPETCGMSKKNAWKAWRKLTAEQRHQAHAALPAFQQQLDDRRRKYADAVPLHAEGYINSRRFETLMAPDPAAAPASRPWWVDPDKLAAVTADQWRNSIAKYANGIWPVAKLGPPPGSVRCVVPPTIVRELRLTEIYTDGGIKRNMGDDHEH